MAENLSTEHPSLITPESSCRGSGGDGEKELSCT